MNERELANLIESGQYAAALAQLRGEPERFDVDEAEVTALVAERMARWGAEFVRSVDAHIATVLNRMRGRVD